MEASRCCQRRHSNPHVTYTGLDNLTRISSLVFLLLFGRRFLGILRQKLFPALPAFSIVLPFDDGVTLAAVRTPEVPCKLPVLGVSISLVYSSTETGLYHYGAHFLSPIARA